jgi:OOP family OmpA-OmpF porin
VTAHEVLRLVPFTAGLVACGGTARAEPVYLVLFEYGRSDISATGQAVIDQVVSDFKRVDAGPILFVGHADRRRTVAAKIELSQRRVEVVRDALIAAGLPKTEIFVRAAGEEEPIVPTPDGVREMANRCVAIWIPWTDVIVEQAQ